MNVLDKFKDSFVVATTHPGRHHLDDVLAAFILQLVFDDRLLLVRSDDRKIETSSDILFDTGKVYDPSNLRFDHHQVGSDLTDGRRPCGRASAGLIWDFFGRHICRELVENIENVQGRWEEARSEKGFDLEGAAERLFDELDRTLLAPVENWDVKRYNYHSDRSGAIPFQWVIQTMSFHEAVRVTGGFFMNQARYILRSYAEELMVRADMNREGGSQIHRFKEGLLVECEGDKRIEMAPVSRVVKDDMGDVLLGVISSLRGGTKKVFMLQKFVTLDKKEIDKILEKYPDMEVHPNYRMFFHHSKNDIRNFAKKAIKKGNIELFDYNNQSG